MLKHANNGMLSKLSVAAIYNQRVQSTPIAYKAKDHVVVA